MPRKKTLSRLAILIAIIIPALVFLLLSGCSSPAAIRMSQEQIPRAALPEKAAEAGNILPATLPDWLMWSMR